MMMTVMKMMEEKKTEAQMDREWNAHTMVYECQAWKSADFSLAVTSYNWRDMLWHNLQGNHDSKLSIGSFCLSLNGRFANSSFVVLGK